MYRQISFSRAGRARNLILLAEAGCEALGNALLLPGPEGLPRRVLEVNPANAGRSDQLCLNRDD